MTSAEVTPPRHIRLAIALLLGLLAGRSAYFFTVTDPKPRDFAAVWDAARAIVLGIEPATVASHSWYPLPSILAGIPWVILPTPELGAAVFMMVGGTALAWALMEHGYWPLLGFFAGGMRFAVEVVQWSPLFAGAFAIAPLALCYVIKPHVGLAMWVARPSWWGVAGVVGFTALAFLVAPTWVTQWRTALASGASLGVRAQYSYTAPVLLPGGFLVLLAILRWRRPEARLLFALACVPQSLLFYETVPLALIPRGWKESTLYFVLSWVALVYVLAQRPWPDENLTKALTMGRVAVFLLFVPLTLIVLRRPNEGPVPAWLERRLARWPSWIRGVPT